MPSSGPHLSCPPFRKSPLAGPPGSASFARPVPSCEGTAFHRIRDKGLAVMADVGGIAAERLRSFIERIERLEEEKAALSADVREVFAEAKGNGFDTKICLLYTSPSPRDS